MKGSLMTKQKEKILQKNCQDYLNILGIEFIHIVSFIQRKINGTFHNFSIENNKGFPDIMIFLKDKILFVELKTDKGKIQEYQTVKFDKLNKLGHSVHIIRDFKTFKELIDEYI
jgi:hypothetical protein